MSPVSSWSFQPTHPLRGATRSPWAGSRSSPHFNPCTPCGVRPLRMRLWSRPGYFNPRTPCGVRRTIKMTGLVTFEFQSAHPSRGAASTRRGKRSGGYFNPRTPRGVRRNGCGWRSSPPYFNPRTPRRVRPARAGQGDRRHPISTRAPLAGCDWPLGAVCS